ncbi:MAG: Gfo/Idh/MocA family oxidoreductase [Cypionkella sp.]
MWGCRPIAQAAHFESCIKPRNAEFYAICDVADDLREPMAATHPPARSYNDSARMLADPELGAALIATSNTLHVPTALQAGKHVLCEKPLAVDGNLEERPQARENPQCLSELVLYAGARQSSY